VRSWRDAAILGGLALTLVTGAAPEPEPGPLPSASPALDDTRDRLPHRFIAHETARFVVLSDADPAWARHQGECLERAYHQFLRFARRLRLEPDPLRHKLVCVLFDRRDDYLAFASTHDDVDEPWIAGYYAPDNERVVFYHGDSNPSVIEARSGLDRLREDLETIAEQAQDARHRGRLARATALADQRDRYREHIERESARVDAFARHVNVATTVHEAVHQLLFTTGLQSRHVVYPAWISEGLATAFETDDPRAAFGPDHDHERRREGFRELLEAGGLLDLDTLATVTDLPPHDDTLVRAVYLQSYALVTWMCRFRQTELRRYLELMREEPDGDPTPARHRALFEEAFGDVAALERAWLRHEQG
jgi:hypothetical protein